MAKVSPNLNTIPSFELDLSKENNPPPLDIWDVQFHYDVGGESGSIYLIGIGFDGEYFYCPESASSLIHKFKKNGSYIGSFSISGVPNLMDLAYDGEYFYGTAQNSSNVIYEMDFENEALVSTITAPAAAWNIAYDSDDDAFWIGQWSIHLTKIDREGNILDEIPVPESMLGIAYDNTFEYYGYNGPFLWIFTGTSSYPSTPAIIKCIDIDSKELIPDFEWNVADDLGAGIAGGLELTYDWDNIILVLIGIVQGSGIDDYAFGYEIGWHWGPHDIGVKNIVSPEDGDAAEDMEVIVQIRNHGNSTEGDIPVNVVILKDGADEEYNETEYVDVIYSHETVDVEMPSWTPDDWQSASNKYIDYKITAQVTLWGDDNPSNDYKEKWFELYFSYFHDVGCTDVSGPENGPAQTFKVNATIKNFGQYDECCFKTYVEIAELDIENQEELLTEDFSDYTFPPTGWTRTHDNWMYSDSSYAGGFPGEARFNCSPQSTDFFRLHTSAIDTSDYSAVEIEFKHYVDHFETPYTLQVETSGDEINWNVIWDINPSGNVGPETITILTAQNVGSTTYVSWTFNGNSSNIDSWYVDDIFISGYTSLDPEYEDNQCTTMIDPGEELELEFDDWTPVFLAEETSGIKKYSIKAWTDMEDPPDENPDNDLFANSIKLDFFHDVGFKEIASPSEKGSNKKCWYAVDCNINYFVNWYESGIELLAPTGLLFFQGDASVEDEWCVYGSSSELHTIDLETGKFTYIDALPGSHQFTCLAIPYIIPFPPDRYVPLGSQNIEVIVENIGTFPELDLACYAEIYEYITNCTNGTLVYENNITNIDLDEPLGGTELLNLGSYNFSTEGLYGLFLNLPDDNDDYPNNNEVSLGVGADGTPPVSNHSLDPKTPDGKNGWYVSDVKVTLYAKDPNIGCGHPGSGVDFIEYRIDGGDWQTIPGNNGSFIVDKDGENLNIEYRAVDNIGNVEDTNSFTINMDQTKPDIMVGLEIYMAGLTWYVKFICEAEDATSGMDRVEMYIDDELYENNTGTGPIYEFVIVWSGEMKTSMFKFVAFDISGNSDSDFVNGSDIKSHPQSQSITHHSINIWFLKLLDRFPFLLKLLDILRGYMK